MSLQFRPFYFLTLIFLTNDCTIQHGIIHKVQDGETVLEISHLYDAEVEDVLKANPAIESNELKEGDRILIPSGLMASPKRLKVEKDLELTYNPPPEPEPAPVPIQKKTPRPKKPARPKYTKKVQLALAWPAKGKILSPFGLRHNKMHNGIDVQVSQGSTIQPALEGDVAYVGNGLAGYGDLVILRHDNNFFSVYAYLGKIKVKKGDHVQPGSVLATSTQKGGISFYHFEIRQGKRALNPMNFLSK